MIYKFHKKEEYGIKIDKKKYIYIYIIKSVLS